MVRRFLYIFFLLTSLQSVYGQTIVAIGGGESNKILPVFVEKAGGLNSNILVVAAASSDRKNLMVSGSYYEAEFNNLHVRSVKTLIISCKEDADHDYSEIINRSTGIFFTGGDQRITMDRIADTRLYPEIRSAIKQGKVYGGTSAGTACIGSLMIGSSSSKNDGIIDVRPGLGLIDNIIFDQHFTQRDRTWRLEKVIHDNPIYDGVGIDENTAFIYENGQYTVIGEGKAHYVRSRNSVKKLDSSITNLEILTGL